MMAQPQFQVDRTTALYERPAMDIVDATTFAEVKQTIASAFAPGNVEKFLQSVDRAGVRIRGFETVLKKGLMGKATASSIPGCRMATRGSFASSTWRRWSRWN